MPSVPEKVENGIASNAQERDLLFINLKNSMQVEKRLAIQLVVVYSNCSLTIQNYLD